MKLPVTSLYFHDLTIGLAGFLVVAEQSKYLFLGIRLRVVKHIPYFFDVILCVHDLS